MFQLNARETDILILGILSNYTKTGVDWSPSGIKINGYIQSYFRIII